MSNLLLCLTPGNSLATWQYTHTLERELQLYYELVKHGWHVKILTFAKESAHFYKLPDSITLTRFPNARLLSLLPFLRLDLGMWADIIKTNQSTMSWHYVKAAQLWRKPILLRCGYVAGKNLEHEYGLTKRVTVYQEKELFAFQKATWCQVTTPELRDWITHHYSLPIKKISVIPNFVDLELFKRSDSSNMLPRSVIAIGRLTPLKRFDLLIRACARASVEYLTIIGQGPEMSRLRALGKELNLNLEMPGQVPNTDLPNYLNQHEIYAQVSEWEGHPKSLIEAMACARCCIVTDSTGLANQVQHGVTGWVANSTIESIANGLNMLLGSKGLRNKLGTQAEAYAKTAFAFTSIFPKEFHLLSQLAKKSAINLYE